VAAHVRLAPNLKEDDMRSRLTKLAAGLVAVAALAVGGATLASAGSKANPPVASQSQQEAAPSVDGDKVQQGDQSTLDTAGQASETAGEQADSESEQAAESGPSDGPGGYADTSANADTQQQGEH
jgi:hypothetical protein